MKTLFIIFTLVLLSSCTKTFRIPFSGNGSGGTQGAPSSSPTNNNGSGGVSGTAGFSGTGGNVVFLGGRAGSSGSQQGTGGNRIYSIPVPLCLGSNCEPAQDPETAEDRKFSF